MGYVVMPNRLKAQEYILEFYKTIDRSLYNYKKMKELLEGMSDKEFNEYMVGIGDGSKGLVLFKPMYECDISVQNNLDIGEKYGVKFFERLVYKEGDLEYMTPIEYLVVDLPYRRQSQTLVKKISVPVDNKVIDESVFQPTGDSKGAKISYPELQVLIGMGLDSSINELIRYRGGDRSGFHAYNAMFLRYGAANLKTLESYSSGVESTKTLKSYLTAMHLSNTI